MPSAAVLRLQIESALSARIPSALTPAPRVIRPTAPTGIAALDERLGGGLPVGALSELTGPECSGRTSLALSFLAGMTDAGRVCAWVDVSDALDPESAAAVGVDLERLLWVCCGEAQPVELPRESGAGDKDPEVSGGGTERRKSLREKSQFEGKDIPQGLKPNVSSAAYGTAEALPLQNNSVFPQAENPRSFKTGSHSGAGKMQEPDRASRHTNVSVTDTNVRAVCDASPLSFAPRCAEPQPRVIRKSREVVAVREEPAVRSFPAAQRPRKPWSRLDQALRATDLLLQAGGFSAIVLDMGSVAPEFALRVPLATWFRYRAAAERTHASVLLLTQQACTKSSAGVVLTLRPDGICSEGSTVLTGAEHRVEIARERFARGMEFARKPPQSDYSSMADSARHTQRETALRSGFPGSVRWQTRTAWAGREDSTAEKRGQR